MNTSVEETPTGDTATADQPVRAGRWSDTLPAFIGGRLGRWGRRGEHAGVWFDPMRWVLLAATIIWLWAVTRQEKCQLPGSDVFRDGCYSDIPKLYLDRDMVNQAPMSQTPFEYPALTAAYVELNRQLTALFSVFLPGTPGPEARALEMSNLFLGITAVTLFALFLGLVWSMARTTRGRGWDTMMVAASPLVALTGLINWDLLAVCLTSLALLAWSRRSPWLAGLLLGLATAAKLYPLLILGPLLLLCLRGGRMKAYGWTVLGAAVGWLVGNISYLALNFEGWLYFWTFNEGRGPDFGSLWQAMTLQGQAIANLNGLAIGLMVAACIGIAALVLFAPQRPRLAQVAFLVVVAMCLINKVYSPQYVLWLLPLAVAARPKLRDVAMWQVAEAIYWVAIWHYLANWSDPDLGQFAIDTYSLAVVIRVAAQLWFAGLVVRDILQPIHDPVRIPPAHDRGRLIDDPAGGVLDGAADVGWFTRLRTGALQSFAIPGTRAYDRINDVTTVRWPAATAVPWQTVPGYTLTRDPWTRRGLQSVLLAWIGSRGLIVAILVVMGLITGSSIGTMLTYWDVQHFFVIAQEGYADPKEMAFFPGLPMIMGALAQIGIPMLVTGMVLSLVGSAAAALALLRLGGPVAATMWLFAPVAVFTVVPYTESLFCALAFWAWERARADRWMPAAILAALACTVRVSGLFLVGALGIMALTWAAVRWRERLLKLLWLALPIAVIAAYVIYLHGLTGSWTAWFSAQEAGWNRGFHWPWEAFANTWQAIQPGAYADRDGWVWIFRAEMLAWLAGIAVTVWCLRRKMWAEASWVAVQVLAFALSFWFQSVPRAVLLWFPFWMMMASFWERKPRDRDAAEVQLWSKRVLIVLGLFVMMWWTRQFFNGGWAS
ncbi:glycosyltransferase 87 family protein [Parenemella sanctibonifatiensis]|uniref:DUF2029 domain-containing protein n=1 Tax=Parenemella sanctibonifatiensis TaxID=2016505 RepID=A0A255DYC3_9ACTN|nr:glycosyltransferase 87 family protein [Parenemella sanctibonifatiensis]OYN84090.1 hypothetical protein CGZ92_13650 [Parenemella sanctibonifatiensis]